MSRESEAVGYPEKELLRILVETMDYVFQAIPSYLIALSIICAANILSTTLILMSATYPRYTTVAFVAAPLYLLLVPFLSIMRIIKTRPKFFVAHKNILLGELKQEVLTVATSHANTVQRWWRIAIFALFLYVVLSFAFVSILVVFQW